MNLINRIIDGNSQVLAAARHQVRHNGLLMLLGGIGFIFFAIVAYLIFERSFLPYFLGFMGILTTSYGILRLGRKEQYPNPDENNTQP